MKKVTIRTLLASLCAISWSAVYSQSTDPTVKQQIVEQVGRDSYSGVVQTYDDRYEGIRGTPFLSEEWQPGTFTYSDGTTYREVPMKYDLQADKLWVKNKLGQEVIVIKNRLQQFTLTNDGTSDSLRFVKAQAVAGLTQLIEPERMVQILYNQSFMVVALRKKMLNKASYQGGYSPNRTYDEFIEIDPQYFVITESGDILKFRPKKKSLLRNFPNYEGAIKKYLKDREPNLLDPNVVGDLFHDITRIN